MQVEQDRQSNERNHATTDFITREIASLRLAVNDVATRDFVRGELRDLLEELEEPPPGMSTPCAPSCARRSMAALDRRTAEPTSDSAKEQHPQ